MKKLAVLAVWFFIVMGVSNAFAFHLDLDLSAMVKCNFYTDPSLEQGKGIEVKLGSKLNKKSPVGIFLFGSYDQTMMRLYGQRAGDISLLGIGAGLKIELVKGLALAGKIGYFHPTSTMAKNAQDFGEVFHYRVMEYENLLPLTPEQKKYSLDWYTKYEYELKGNIGGGVELTFNKEIYKGLSFNIFAGYNFLKLPERFWMKSKDPRSYIEFFGDRNFSSGTIGVGLTYRF